MNDKKEPTVQIEKSLFLDCVSLICAEIDDVELWRKTADRLEEKLKKMVNRKLYTTYKTAETEEEREAARVKYLESIGMPRGYRW